MPSTGNMTSFGIKVRRCYMDKGVGIKSSWVRGVLTISTHGHPHKEMEEQKTHRVQGQGLQRGRDWSCASDEPRRAEPCRQYRTDNGSEPPKGGCTADTFISGCSPRTLRESPSVALSHQVCGNLLQPQGTVQVNTAVSREAGTLMCSLMSHRSVCL